jgi:DNA-binding GntR family transcriptional regulator
LKHIPTQKEIVYEQIKRAIIYNEIKPGEILKEIELSQMYNVGKTPIREALIILVHENYLKTIPRAGYVVVAPAVQDIMEMFHLRMILEVESVAQAIDRLSDEEIAQLIENCNEEMLLYQSDNKQKIRELGYGMNQDFHMAIAQASGNSRLALIVEQLMLELQRVLMNDPNLIEPTLVDHTQHESIIRFIQRRDKINAQEAMRKHIDDTRNRVIHRFY